MTNNIAEGVFERFPAKEWVLIADNLSTHISKDTQAALLAFDQEVQMLFPPFPKGGRGISLNIVG